MKKRVVSVLLSILSLGLLAACATQPIGPQTREEWTALHTRDFVGVTDLQALRAARNVLELADHDFRFDFPPDQLMATRGWSIYMVLAVAIGTDYWRISTTSIPDGTRLTVQITRASGAMTPSVSPVIGGAGGVGVGAQNTGMRGAPIRAPFPYNLFWERMQYMLGHSPHWITCKEAEADKSSSEKKHSDVLCSVTTDDKRPTSPEFATKTQTLK